ncbi:hypothetical protein [Legionella spiritensis]|uniref:Vir region protein n=1 Tax=Legionella spiritensis TaxID=452 RepID=A0A0W0Z5P0_LEGSP|nr:hypothetical protein [Legionella spiritensis]KTD64429.1 vir region protein [Legionella spiritensis]SNV45913.1 Legionella vir region protein [Legionella spiritensis]
MDFVVNSEELAALYGLPHNQQLAYLRGIRPYMDVKTGLVGVRRRISLQSLAEELHIQPHQGIKGEKFSRPQARRALSALERVGLITLQSEELQLILKCNLATLGCFTQNKVVTNPSQKAVTFFSSQSIENKGLYGDSSDKPVTVEPSKAVTPLIKEDNYIYLLRRFEHFWRLYPEKKSRERAFETFQQINPDESLLRTMLQALDNQIKARTAKDAHGEWVPPWKYPANWLAQKCWEDEVNIELKQEKRNEKRRPNTKTTTVDPFWNPETEDTASSSEDEYQQSNVINLQCYRQQ